MSQHRAERRGEPAGAPPGRALHPADAGEDQQREAPELGQRDVGHRAQLLVGEDHEREPGPGRRGVPQAEPADQQVHRGGRQGEARQRQGVVGDHRPEERRDDPPRPDRGQQRHVDRARADPAEGGADELLGGRAPEAQAVLGVVPEVPHVARGVATTATARDVGAEVAHQRPRDHDAHQGEAREHQQHLAPADRAQGAQPGIRTRPRRGRAGGRHARWLRSPSLASCSSASGAIASWCSKRSATTKVGRRRTSS